MCNSPVVIEHIALINVPMNLTLIISFVIVESNKKENDDFGGCCCCFLLFPPPFFIVGGSHLLTFPTTHVFEHDNKNTEDAINADDNAPKKHDIKLTK